MITKHSVVQKVSSGQTFANILNFRCDLDLECSNQIFPQDTPAYDAVLSNQVWLQSGKQFRRYNKKKQSYFDYISPHCDHNIEDSEPIFLHDTLPWKPSKL